ncbi:uncharacterized protein BX663DRAFT_491413 [Cokeromyces recurvatus]|uniref:uncharacterized protein n=1 Tax=Cokeromyces recurvatus TaxID=90255 RepID=UPI00221F5F78|nr:uncharacterized protein BX663DRAFT_491413 [Cokeromyces recurvatus]KAI7907600.1 hypothetical protein BX663DRAFT_491413 [Cokeromyces recurvatus]
MTNIRVISQSDISRILSQGNTEVANEIVDIMAKTFRQFTEGQNDKANENERLASQSPQRIGISTEAFQVLFMPSRLDHTTSIKVVSVPTKEGLSGLPATILVIDETTGSTEAVMNATSLTAIRTAAGSGLATRYFAHPEAKNLVVLGAGAQAKAHIDIMISIRPSIERISIWNRSEQRRLELIKELQQIYPTRTFVSAVGDDNSSHHDVNAFLLEEEVRKADIICTCTNATDPILVGQWLKPGVHLNCIGSYRLDMHEIDSDTVKRAELIIVDSIKACSHEAGELVASSKPEDWLEIGQYMIDNEEIETKYNEKITLFKSVGISVQDSAIAGLIVKHAKKEKLGTIVPF